jgi:hypothetical protein
MRRIFIIAGCWLAGPILAVTFLLVPILFKAPEVCPYPEGCALEPIATWKFITFLLLIVGPGLWGTWYTLRRQPGAAPRIPGSV